MRYAAIGGILWGAYQAIATLRDGVSFWQWLKENVNWIVGLGDSRYFPWLAAIALLSLMVIGIHKVRSAEEKGSSVDREFCEGVAIRAEEAFAQVKTELRLAKDIGVHAVYRSDVTTLEQMRAAVQRSIDALNASINGNRGLANQQYEEEVNAQFNGIGVNFDVMNGFLQPDQRIEIPNTVAPNLTYRDPNAVFDPLLHEAFLNNCRARSELFRQALAHLANKIGGLQVTQREVFQRIKAYVDTHEAGG